MMNSVESISDGRHFFWLFFPLRIFSAFRAVSIFGALWSCVCVLFFFVIDRKKKQKKNGDDFRENDFG